MFTPKGNKKGKQGAPKKVAKGGAKMPPAMAAIGKQLMGGKC